MEVIGLLGITFTLVNNMFRSFLYVFDIPNENPVPKSLEVLWALDTIASPIFVLPFLLILKPFVMTIFDKCVTINNRLISKKNKTKVPEIKKSLTHSSSTYC